MPATSNPPSSATSSPAPHFLIVLTPSALERCDQPGDWLRREIETAIESKRNIVPLMIEGFSFNTPAIAAQLTGNLAALRHYNGLGMPAEYFLAAMEKLRTKFLNINPEAVPHPATPVAQQAAVEQKTIAQAAPPVPETQLTAQEYFERAYSVNDPDEEIRLNSEAIRLQPDFAEAFNNRGIAHQAKGDLETAIRDYDQAIRFRPDYADAYNNRGAALRAKGNPETAIRDYDQAIWIKSDFSTAFYNRGIAHQAKGNLETAIRDYDQAIRIRPDYADAFFNRANAHLDTGNLDATIRDYDQVIRIKSGYVDAYVNRGIAHDAKGDSEAAIRDYDQAIRLKPDDWKAFYNRGNAHRAKGDLDAAIRDFDQAIQVKTDYAKAFYNRGNAFNQKGDLAPAIADLQRYLDLGGGELNGNTAMVQQRIAELRYQLSKTADHPPEPSSLT